MVRDRFWKCLHLLGSNLLALNVTCSGLPHAYKFDHASCMMQRTESWSTYSFISPTLNTCGMCMRLQITCLTKDSTARSWRWLPWSSTRAARIAKLEEFMWMRYKRVNESVSRGGGGFELVHDLLITLVHTNPTPISKRIQKVGFTQCVVLYWV